LIVKSIFILIITISRFRKLEGIAFYVVYA